MLGPDLKIVDKDIRTAYTNLERIANDFNQNAQVAQDVSAALGHETLARRLRDFSDSWRVNRDRMAKAFESLAKDLRTKLEAFDAIDEPVDSNNPVPQPDDRDNKSTENSNQDQPVTTDQNVSRQNTTPNRLDPTNRPSLTDSWDSGRAGTSTQTLTPSAASDYLTNGPEAHASADNLAGPDADQDLSVSTQGGFHASAAVTAGSAAAVTATLLALHRAWESAQQRSSSSAGGLTDEDQDVRTRLIQELERMKLGTDGSGTLEIKADPKDPGDVMAILRGDDGSTTTLHIGDGDDVPGIPEPSDAAADTGAGLSAAAEAPSDSSSPSSSGEEATADPDGDLEQSATGDLGTLAGAGGGEGLGPDLPTSASEPSLPMPDAPSSASPGDPMPGTLSSSHSLPETEAPPMSALEDEHVDVSGTRHAAAGATAGVGMMGMGMASAASSGPAATPRARLDERRHRHDDEVAAATKTEGDRAK